MVFFTYNIGKENPSWASINNAVLICNDCSELHRALGSYISKIKSINSSEWAHISLEHLEAVGNNGFINLIQKYTLPEKPTLAKYQTKAAEYYRLKIDTMAKRIPFDVVAPSLSDGKEVSQNTLSIEY